MYVFLYPRKWAFFQLFEIFHLFDSGGLQFRDLTKFELYGFLDPIRDHFHFLFQFLGYQNGLGVLKSRDQEPFIT